MVEFVACLSPGFFKWPQLRQVGANISPRKKVTAVHVRDLRGVVDREKAEIGVLIYMAEPTKPMRTEAASAGFYTSPWGGKKHPRLQILTIEDLLAGKEIDYPPHWRQRNLRQSPQSGGRAFQKTDLAVAGQGRSNAPKLSRKF